jgi:sodium/pantothenate symporter
VLGVVGKKLAVVGRKIDAITVIDVIRARYGSDALANLSALVIVVFFAAAMVAQFVGGAQLFSAAADVDYKVGLLIFALVVVVYTSVGGFRGVVLTDTICAVAMLIGMSLLMVVTLKQGGGIAAIVEKVAEDPKRMQPEADGRLSITFLMSQWLLCGFCTLALPQSLVRCMSYRDSKSLHRAMIYGTIVIGAMMLGMHLLGVLSRGVISEVPAGKTTDAIIPTLKASLSPILAGLVILGPLASTMSTVSSLLISASSSIIKDVYQYYRVKRAVSLNKDANLKPARLEWMSVAVTFIIGVVCLIIAMKPPSVIVWINLFASGGLQSAFFWMFILGLFWKRANATGALVAMAGGVVAYCVMTVLTASHPTLLGGFHQIVVGIVVSLVLFVIGSLACKPREKTALAAFFPE